MPYGTVNADLMTTSDGVSSSGLYGFKNRIINGAMVIDQRNAGASVTITANPQYTLDRWFAGVTNASKISVQQNAGSVTPPVGFTKYLGVTSLAATTPASSDVYYMQQSIEGFNIADLAWGTASAKTITISFQVYSSLTGTFGAVILNAASNRSYPFNYTISSANTWTSISVTIAGDTTGTWAIDNTTGIQLRFGLGAGSTYQGTAGAWGTANVVTTTGATSVIGTNGATFYITGVQLEKGSVATSFDYRPYGTELDLCQRYFEITGQIANSFLLQGYAASAGAIRCLIFYTTRKRTTPTVTVSGGGTTGWSYSNASGLFIAAAGVDTTRAEFNASAAGITYVYNIDGGYITSSAEL
jgi:hypothetical protein